MDVARKLLSQMKKGDSVVVEDKVMAIAIQREAEQIGRHATYKGIYDIDKVKVKGYRVWLLS